jgi:ribosomal-protein-alanine N-acetyltransferase
MLQKYSDNHDIQKSENFLNRVNERNYLVVCPKMDLILKPYTNYLSSNRLFLRPIFPNDYMSLEPIYKNPLAMKYFAEGVTFTDKQIKERVSHYASDNVSINPEGYHWAIITKYGIVGKVSSYYPEENEEENELAYYILPNYNGLGLTTEASRLVIEAVGGKFLATVHPKNTASIRVLEKLGFHADTIRRNVPLYGQVRDFYTKDTSLDIGRSF